VANDHYLILGVPPDATAEEIRAAWRRQVRYWHPDRNPDPRAARRIQLLNHAYGVLSDAVQRAAYDGARSREDVSDDAQLDYEDEYDYPDEDAAPTAPAPRPDAPGHGRERVDVTSLLARLDALLREANRLLARPAQPSPTAVEPWAASAEALVEQSLGRWNSYTQHLQVALMPGDARARLTKASGVLSSIRVDVVAGNIRPDMLDRH
jgi:curved DNA-binding protein CbpA